MTARLDFGKAQSELATKGSIKIRARAHSMRPLINDGDELHVVPILNPLRDLRPGDIIVFRKNNLLLCHVLINMQKDHVAQGHLFITQGYNCDQEDSPVPEFDLLGRVINFKLTRRKFLLWRLKIFFRR